MELPDRVARLTIRQRECLWLVLRGFETKEVAAELAVKPETVEYHLRKARETLGVGRSSTAARILSEHEPPPSGWTLGGPSIVEECLSIRDTALAEGQPPSPELADSGQTGIYLPPSIWMRPPLPTIGRTENDLTLRSRLAWTVGIALGLAALLAVFMGVLH